MGYTNLIVLININGDRQVIEKKLLILSKNTLNVATLTSFHGEYNYALSLVINDIKQLNIFINSLKQVFSSRLNNYCTLINYKRVFFHDNRKQLIYNILNKIKD